MITKDIINVIGYNIIQDSIIDEVKRAGFYSVLADHMSSHNDQYLPIFLHFVDDSCEIMEEFIHFAKLERVIAPDIANIGCITDVTVMSDDGYVFIVKKKKKKKCHCKDIVRCWNVSQ